MRKRMPNIFERDVEKISNLSFSNGKAIIYTRISSKNQKKGISLDSQQKLCENYCFENNYDIIGQFSEVISAKSSSNQKILHKIIEGYSNINLVVNEASRFSRNFKDAVVLIDMMMKRNIILHCVDRNLICSNNNDFKNIMSDLKDAEIEIQTLSRRVKRTINFKKMNNTFFPSVPKYGKKYVKIICGSGTNIKVENDITEQKIISLIRLMFYGSSSGNIENLLKEITGNNQHKLYDYERDVEINKVERGNFTKKSIADFLNYINIFKRGKKWSSGMISGILQQTE